MTFWKFWVNIRSLFYEKVLILSINEIACFLFLAAIAALHAAMHVVLFLFAIVVKVRYASRRLWHDSYAVTMLLEPICDSYASRIIWHDGYDYTMLLAIRQEEYGMIAKSTD